MEHLTRLLRDGLGSARALLLTVLVGHAKHASNHEDQRNGRDRPDEQSVGNQPHDSLRTARRDEQLPQLDHPRRGGGAGCCGFFVHAGIRFEHFQSGAVVTEMQLAAPATVPPEWRRFRRSKTFFMHTLEEIVDLPLTLDIIPFGFHGTYRTGKPPRPRLPRRHEQLVRLSFEIWGTPMDEQAEDQPHQLRFVAVSGQTWTDCG